MGNMYSLDTAAGVVTIRSHHRRGRMRPKLEQSKSRRHPCRPGQSTSCGGEGGKRIVHLVGQYVPAARSRRHPLSPTDPPVDLRRGHASGQSMTSAHRTVAMPQCQSFNLGPSQVGVERSHRVPPLLDNRREGTSEYVPGEYVVESTRPTSNHPTPPELFVLTDPLPGSVRTKTSAERVGEAEKLRRVGRRWFGGEGRRRRKAQKGEGRWFGRRGGFIGLPGRSSR